MSITNSYPTTTLIQRHGTPYTTGDNLFTFLHTRIPLTNRIRTAQPHARTLLSAATSLPTTFQCVENVTSVGTMFLQSKATLEHAAQQLEYLIHVRHLLPLDFLAIAHAYRTTYQEMHHQEQEQEDIILFVPHLKQLEQQFFMFNTLLYYPQLSTELNIFLQNGHTALAPKQAGYWEQVEATYYQDEVVVIDTLLSKWLLDLIYQFCLEATIYWELKQQGEYIGAYQQFDLYNDLFQVITTELRAVLPAVIGDQVLTDFWSYKYLEGDDGDGTGGTGGVPLHADYANVNLNLWITPNEAHADHGDGKSGGMDIYKYHVRTKEEYDRFQYQRQEITNQIIENKMKNKVQKITVPYLRNRLVLFRSDLVHRTSKKIRFKTGYVNRRINLTWLFGNQYVPSDRGKAVV